MANHSSIPAWRKSMDRGAWWATVHGVWDHKELDTGLSDQHTNTPLCYSYLKGFFFFQSLMYYDFFCKCLSSVVEKNVHCVIVCGRILYVCFLTVHLKTYHNLTTYSWGICLDSSHKVNMRFLWTSQFFKIYLPRLSYYMKTSIKLFMLLSDLVHDYTVISTWWEKKSILY